MKDTQTATPRFFVGREVGELLRVNLDTIHRWRRAGVLEAVRVGRGWLFPSAAVEAALARAAAQTTSDQEIFARVLQPLP
jgi:excisionase family DNA binding protein